MIQLIQHLNEVANVWWPLVMHAAWQGAVVGILVLAIIRFGKRLPAPLRHGLLLLALAKFLAPPLLSLPCGLLSQIEAPASHSIASADATESGAITTAAPLDRSEGGADTNFHQLETAADRPSLPADDGSIGMSTLIGDAERERVLAQPAHENQGGTRPLASAGTRPTISRGSHRAEASWFLAELAQLHWAAWLLLLHVAGTLLFLTAVIVRMWQLKRILGSSTAIEADCVDTQAMSRQLGLRRTPRLLMAPGLWIPFSTGILRPAVVLPGGTADQLSDSQLKAVILHELTHHRRRDLWIIWIQVLVASLWWFHPVVWLVNRAIRRVREECCDDFLLSRKLIPNRLYCETLVTIATQFAANRKQIFPLAVGMASSGHPLAQRLTRIMDSGLQRRDRTGSLAMLGLILVAALLLPGLSPAGDSARTSTSETTQAAVAKAYQTLHGQLLDTDGQPVADASVWLTIKEIWQSSDDGPRILCTGKSGADGRFELQYPKSELRDVVINQYTEFSIWAHDPEYQLARIVTKRNLPKSLEPMSLSPASTTRLKILAPHDTPIGGGIAYVDRMQFGRDDYVTIPREIQRRMQREVSTDGVVEVVGIPWSDQVSVVIETLDHGSQTYFFWPRMNQRIDKLALRAVGSIRGRLTLPANDNVDLSKFKVRVSTAGSPPGDVPRLEGWAQSVVDKQGHFQIPKIAEGIARISVIHPDLARYQAVVPKGLVVSANESTELQIPLKRTLPAKGVIREAGSQLPISGARVWLQLGHRSFDALTDSEGTFRVLVLPNTRYHVSYNLPGNYLMPHDQEAGSINVSESTAQLRPVEVVKGRSLTGKVVAHDGTPLSNVLVGANWQGADEFAATAAAEAAFNARAWATTDSRGNFQLDCLPPTGDLEIAPVRAGVLLCLPRTIPSKQSEPIRLESRKFQCVSLKGRITDMQGRPLPGVYAQFYLRPGTSSNEQVGQVFSVLETTDNAGSFATLPVMPLDYSYRVSVQTFGHEEVATSDWFHPKTAGSNTIPDLKVDRSLLDVRPPHELGELAALVARVTDVNDRPISGAHVIVWHSAQRLQRPCDDDGRVSFPNVPPQGTWMFAFAAGYQFHGEYVERVHAGKLIVLRKTGHPPRRNLATIASRPADSPLQELANVEVMKFVDMTFNQTGGKEIQREKVAAHRLLASVDPEAALQLIDDPRLDLSELKFANSDTSYAAWQANRIRFDAAQRIAETDFARAFAVAREMTDARFRARAFLVLADLAPQHERPQLLGEALKLSESISDGTGEVEHLTSVGASFLGAGDRSQAEELFTTARKKATQLSDSERAGFSRGYLAWEMAPVDPNAALALIKSTPAGDDRDRYLGNIAHQVAAIDPALAEKLLGQMSDSRYRGGRAIRVAYRMAGENPDAARRVALSIRGSRCLQAYALGLIADSANHLDTLKRCDYLDEAYEILQRQVDSGAPVLTSNHAPLKMAVSLLPIVERVSPEQLDSRFWQTLAMRSNTSFGSTTRLLGRHGRGQRVRLADPVLGAFLARYDLQQARLLTLSPDDQTLDLGFRDAPYYLLGALAILDPETAIRTASKLPDTDARQRDSKRRAWNQVLTMLNKSAQERWNYLLDHQYYLWRPDEVDR